MSWWIWVLIFIYVVGFVCCLLFHMINLQMVTFPLALLRSSVWPIYLMTGWPHGVPLRMD